MSSRSWPRGSLNPISLTQIPLRLHPLCSTAAPLSPASMTHQSLPPMHSSSHSLNHVFYLGAVFAAVGACARPARVRCAGRPGTDCCPPERLVKRGGGGGGLASWCLPESLLRFHSRNVCQRPLQDHAGAAVWAPLHCIHRGQERQNVDSSPGVRRFCSSITYRSELCELSWS